MTVIEFTKSWLPGGPKGYYHLSDPIDRDMVQVKNAVQTKHDMDVFIIVDGREGAGKSTLASQLAYRVDPTFNHERMCLTPDEFIAQVNRARKGQAIVYDEAFTGLSSRSALSQINKLMIEMLMEMRKKNLFVIIVLPSVFYLEKYVVLHRAMGLYHTFFTGKQRGKYVFYNKQKLKWLYLRGKQNMDYSQPRINFRHRFVKSSPIDWDSYEDRKIKALKKKEKGRLQEKQQAQRDFLISLLYKKGFNQNKLNKLLKKVDMSLSQAQISDSINNFNKKYKPNWEEIDLFWGKYAKI